MGKTQKENGFMLYAKDLRKRYQAKGERHLDWDEFFKSVASESWAKLDPEEKARWKIEAKEAKVETKRKTRNRQGRPGSDDSMCGDKTDEVDILEKLPRKHNRDVKKILDQWIWDFAAQKEKQKDKRFLLLSCQYYFQEHIMEENHYFPAEIALIEWSLNAGILDEFHQIIPLKGEPESDQAKEELLHRRSYIHGIGKDEKLLSCYKSVDRGHKLMSLLTRHTRIYCFSSEFLQVGGILDWLSGELGMSPVLKLARLVCVEDLFSAMVRWDRTELGVDVQDFRDLHDVVWKCHPYWSSNLCDEHVQIQMSSAERDIQLFCSMALVRGAVYFIRKWISEKAVEPSVLKVVGDASQSQERDFDLRLLRSEPSTKGASSFAELSGKEVIVLGSTESDGAGESTVNSGGKLSEETEESRALEDIVCATEMARLREKSQAEIPSSSKKKVDSQPSCWNRFATKEDKEKWDTAAAYSGLRSPKNERGKKMEKEAEEGGKSSEKEKRTAASWESIQRRMNVGSRGIGRGLALFDWDTVCEEYMKAVHL